MHNASKMEEDAVQHHLLGSLTLEEQVTKVFGIVGVISEMLAEPLYQTLSSLMYYTEIQNK